LEKIDSVIEEFHKQNPKIPAQHLRKLLDEKMKAMGWSSLTEREASLILKSEVKKSIKEIQESGTLSKQEELISGEIASVPIRELYLSLYSDLENLKKCKIAAVISLIAALGTVLGSVYIGNLLTIGLPNAFIIPGTLLFTSLIAAIISIKFVLKKKNKLFFYTCGIYWKLNEFIHNRTLEKQIDVLNFVEKVSYDAVNWSYRTTPPPFSKQTDIFYEALMNLWILIGEIQVVDKNKVIDPTENENKIKVLETFNEKLRPQVDLTFQKQLSSEEIPDFIKIFELIRKRKTEEIPQPKEKIKLFFERIRKFFERIKLIFIKYPLLLFIFPPISGLVVYYFQLPFYPDKEFETLQTSIYAVITVFAALLVVVYYMKKPNQQ